MTRATHDTPATITRRNGRPCSFAELAIGDTFECNGNLWTKRTTRTAAGVWPACLPAWAYFGKRELCYA